MRGFSTPNCTKPWEIIPDQIVPHHERHSRPNCTTPREAIPDQPVPHHERLLQTKLYSTMRGFPDQSVPHHERLLQIKSYHTMKGYSKEVKSWSTSWEAKIRDRIVEGSIMQDQWSSGSSLRVNMHIECISRQCKCGKFFFVLFIPNYIWINGMFCENWKRKPTNWNFCGEEDTIDLR